MTEREQDLKDLSDYWHRKYKVCNKANRIMAILYLLGLLFIWYVK